MALLYAGLLVGVTGCGLSPVTRGDGVVPSSAASGAGGAGRGVSGMRSSAAPTPRFSTSRPTGGKPASRPDLGDLTLSFDSLEVRLGGAIGLAVAPVGQTTDPADVTRLGPLQSDVAWSTAKVPLAIGALRHKTADRDSSDVRASITASDNAAAQRLWDGLGGGRTAGTAVDSVLRALGDTRTMTNTRRSRPPYTAFGQTVWTATDQSRVVAALACSSDPSARVVYRLMGQVEAGQSWGLGRRAGSHFKGGWGPDRAGRYLVRQMGVLSVNGSPILGVSILAKPADGSFAAGIIQVDAVAAWLSKHLHAFPTGHC